MKKTLDVIAGVCVLVCGLYALQMRGLCRELHNIFDGWDPYSPAIFLLLAVGTLLVGSTFGLLFMRRRAGAVGTVALLGEAGSCGYYLRAWWFVTFGFALLATAVFGRFVRLPALHAA